jgi:hypothetical protein
MKKQKLIPILFSGLFLIGCSNNDIYGENVSNKYLDKTPYINVLVQKEASFIDVSTTDYINKIENKETFICLLHSSSCGACKAAKEHYLIPYMEETLNTIYALDAYSETNRSTLSEIIKYQPEGSNYVYYNSNNEVVVKRPLLQIVENGEVIVYELGVSKNLIYMLDGYIVR